MSPTTMLRRFGTLIAMSALFVPARAACDNTKEIELQVAADQNDHRLNQILIAELSAQGVRVVDAASTSLAAFLNPGSQPQRFLARIRVENLESIGLRVYIFDPHKDLVLVRRVFENKTISESGYETVASIAASAVAALRAGETIGVAGDEVRKRHNIYLLTRDQETGLRSPRRARWALGLGYLGTYWLKGAGLGHGPLVSARLRRGRFQGALELSFTLPQHDATIDLWSVSPATRFGPVFDVGAVSLWPLLSASLSVIRADARGVGSVDGRQRTTVSSHLGLAFASIFQLNDAFDLTVMASASYAWLRPVFAEESNGTRGTLIELAPIRAALRLKVHHQW